MVVWLAGFFVAPHFGPHFSEGITTFLGFLIPLDSTHSEKGIELDVRKNEVILTGIGEKPKKRNGRDGEIRTRDLCTPSAAR